MSEENKALMRRWFEEVWNKQRFEAVEELFAADGVAYGLGPEAKSSMNGPADFKPFHANFCGAFPDLKVVVEDMIAEGDKVASRITVRGQHTGDHLGVAASQAPVEFTGMVIVRIKDGKFVEAWNNIDFMQLNQQIGLA
ncbi:MAG TPA: ester cyclase [Pyrinomonadaceae bacterium]|nr:ester cyclase [Pyrinomonadaceae bacterium]